jgi:hypothetical protein
MLKYLVCGAFAAALALPGTAQAWTFSASGSAACDRASGQYLVTWTIDNSSEPEVLTITASNRAAVPTGATVGARASSTFTESVAGNTSGSLGLTVSGNWPSDSRARTRGTSVSLAGDCTAPPPPAPPPPVTTMGDDCPNLEGVQGSVPEGWMLNDKGECVEKPTAPPPAPVVQAAPPPAAAPVPAPAPTPPATEPATEGVLGATVRPVFPRAKPKSPAKKAKAKVKRKAKVKAKVKKKVRVKVKAAKLQPCAPGTRRWKGRCAPIVKGNG